jgi:hypothetical protein
LLHFFCCGWWFLTNFRNKRKIQQDWILWTWWPPHRTTASNYQKTPCAVFVSLNMYNARDNRHVETTISDEFVKANLSGRKSQSPTKKPRTCVLLPILQWSTGQWCHTRRSLSTVVDDRLAETS